MTMLGRKQMVLVLLSVVGLSLAGCSPQGEAGKAPQRAPLTYTPPAQQQAVIQAPQAAPMPVARTVKVALLIPMTGRNADLGRAMQDAATLALYDKYAALSPTQAAIQVEILPKDTGDTVEMARAAAQSAIEDGAELVLGPVFSDAVGAVAPIVRKAGKQMVSFSNNDAVAQPGVYVFGFMPEAQTARVIDYALDQKMQVGALVPNNVLGQKVLAVAKRQAGVKEGAIAPISLYMPQGIAVDASVDALLAAKVHFDALFIPEVGNTLDTLLRTLAARGVSPATTQLLGTGLWDDHAVIRRYNLEGSLIASSPPELTDGFLTRFKGTYGYVPPRIASLSYDAVALAVTLATTERGFDAAALTNPAGYSGPANGVFRFLPSGMTERALAVLRVRAGQLQTVDPAPALFK